MGEILAFLFIIFVVIPLVIEHFVQILIFVGSVAIVVYLLFTFYFSVLIYFEYFNNNISIQKSKDINPLKEPAFINYFFRKSFIDIKNIFQESIDEYKEVDPLRIGGFIFMSFFTLTHLLLVAFLFLVLYAIRLTVYSIDISYLIIRKFSAACPTCHTKTILPFYRCDNCNKVHKKLYPNEYGFFYHKCECGSLLPAIFFLGRNKLQAECSNCNNTLSNEFIETRKVFIPIIGGSSVGKTNFMFSVVRNFIEKDNYRRGFQINFLDKTTKAKYEEVIKEAKNNCLPKKTANSLPKAFNLVLKKPKKVTWTFYLYDLSGEVFRNTDNINIQRYHEYSSGIIFIIDPFSLREVKKKYKGKLSKVSASNDSIDDILSRLLVSLESTYNIKKTEKYKKPFAVILNKVDELEDEIINKDSEKVKIQLEEWGEHRFLQKISVRFENVNFFAISAVNSLKNTKNDIMVPIMWIANTEGFEN